MLTFAAVFMEANNKLSIGVVGAGHLGRIHLKCIGSSDHLILKGYYDTNVKVGDHIDHQIHRFESLDELIAACDIIDIVTPTPTHFALAKQALEAGKHVFIEKPITYLPEEAKALWNISKQKGLKVQVGHVERFNPAFLALKKTSLNPVFIEGHRLATFNPRGNDVSVVLDLMIHDLDLVLSMVNAPVTEVKASGVCIVSSHHDICNARIEFENGTVANLTASRLSLKQMRKLRLFQPDAYISIDFLNKETQIVELLENEPKAIAGHVNFPLENANPPRWVNLFAPEAPTVNSIQLELESFAECILEDKIPTVGIEQGYRALLLATKIISAIDKK